MQRCKCNCGRSSRGGVGGKLPLFVCGSRMTSGRGRNVGTLLAVALASCLSRSVVGQRSSIKARLKLKKVAEANGELAGKWCEHLRLLGFLRVGPGAPRPVTRFLHLPPVLAFPACFVPPVCKVHTSCAHPLVCMRRNARCSLAADGVWTSEAGCCALRGAGAGEKRGGCQRTRMLDATYA